MELKKPAMAGTLESSDVQITLRPNPGRGIQIDLKSDVKAMFGDAIEATVRAVLDEFGVEDALVDVNDKGALDSPSGRGWNVPSAGRRRSVLTGKGAIPMADNHLMRTSMYDGGTSPVKMIQAGFYNEDCLVYDLEDLVSAGEKDAARLLVYNAVKYQRPKNKYILIRVNGIYSQELDEDLEAAVRAQPDAIRIPKVDITLVQQNHIQPVFQESLTELNRAGAVLDIQNYIGVHSFKLGQQVGNQDAVAPLGGTQADEPPLGLTYLFQLAIQILLQPLDLANRLQIDLSSMGQSQLGGALKKGDMVGVLQIFQVLAQTLVGDKKLLSSF